MAKKNAAATSETTDSPHAGDRVIKFFVNDDAHAKIYLAAAMSHRTMGAFCRDIVMEIAEEMTAKVPRFTSQQSIVAATRSKARQ